MIELVAPDCERCIMREFREGQPVPCDGGGQPGEVLEPAVGDDGASTPRYRYAIIAEAPGKTEVQVGVPLIGPSGMELQHGLADLGVDRKELLLSNALSCRAPDDDFARIDRELTRVNKLRKTVNQEPLPHPLWCCRPRLISELRRSGVRHVLTLGGKALGSLLQDKSVSILARRGGFINLDLVGPEAQPMPRLDTAAELLGAQSFRLAVYPTVHPAYVLRQPRFRRYFRHDLAEALERFSGVQTWVEPEVVIRPSPAQLKTFLYSAPVFALDYETTYREWIGGRRLLSPALQSKVRCLGIGTTDRVMVVPILSVDNQTVFYTPEEESEIRDLLARWMVDCSVLKVGWNSGSYDRMVTQRWLGVDIPISCHIDGILVHRAYDGDAPHDLAFAASTNIPTPGAWKAAHTATSLDATDEELLHYNALDVACTARLVPNLMEKIKDRGLERVLWVDHRIQHYCSDLHRVGLGVHQPTRAAWERKLLDGCDLQGNRIQEEYEDAAGNKLVREYKGAVQWEAEVRGIVGSADFNPLSGNQVRDLLFDRWRFPVLKKTETGLPTVNDEVIRELLTHHARTQAQKDLLNALRWCRRRSKWRGTFVTKLRPCTEFLDARYNLDEDEIAELDTDELYDLMRKRRGVVMADGRLHAGYNSHTVCSGRLSSSDPVNIQTFPPILRDMFHPQPGCVYLYIDKDQLELRMVAALSGSARYKGVFWKVWEMQKRGVKIDKLDPSMDPHSATGQAIFGKVWDTANREQRKVLREFSKTVVYIQLYGAELPTVHDGIVSAEDRYGRLVYADRKMKQTQAVIEAWQRENPEIVRWWSTEVNLARHQGYLAEPILGRRREFYEFDEARCEILNFRSQSAGSALVHLATIQIVENLIPFEKWGPGTGLVNQCHDSLLFEVPIKEAKRLQPQITEAMTQVVKELDMPFPAACHIYTDWATEMKED